MAPPVARNAIRVEGLNTFRRDLRKTDALANREVRGVIKQAAESVAREAASQAPRRSGDMAGAYRSTVVGSRGIVRNRFFYSRFIEFGFHPRGSSTYVPGRELIANAIDRRRDQVVNALGEGIDRAARGSGWR